MKKQCFLALGPNNQGFVFFFIFVSSYSLSSGPRVGAQLVRLGLVFKELPSLWDANCILLRTLQGRHMCPPPGAVSRVNTP